MQIFLDSNIFHNNWSLRNAHFQYLFNFLENTNAQLLISELVIEEVNNKWRQEMQEHRTNLDGTLRKISKLLGASYQPAMDPDPASITYDLAKQLMTKTSNVHFIPYEGFPQKMIVQRALRRTRPFREKDEGYRDTLIWLSLLRYLKTRGETEDVIVITNNKADFFATGKIEWHADLLTDISDHKLACRLLPFDLLVSFINSQVDKQVHAVNHDVFFNEHINELDLAIEAALTEFIESLSIPQFEHLLQDDPNMILFGNWVKHFDWEILEGIEDPQLVTVKEIADNQYYVSYHFNLRNCALDIMYDAQIYDTVKEELKKLGRHFAVDDTLHTIIQFVRPYMTVSFNYEIVSKEITGLVIDQLFFSK